MRRLDLRPASRWLPGLLLACCLPIGPAFAFTSWEHCNLGNEGFQLTLDYVDQERPELRESLSDSWDMLKALRLRECEEHDNEKPRVRSYGEAIQVVDYVQRPHRLFKNRQRGKFTQADVIPTRWYDPPEDEVAEPADAFPEGPDTHHGLNPTIPRQAGLESLRASAGNTHHFQGELFAEMRSAHRDALDAALARHLFYALVLNAISDHFLHDFFAPGHLATQRDNSHDAVALGLHDRINKNKTESVRLRADSERWHELELLRSFIQERCEARADQCPNWITKEKLKTSGERARWTASQAVSLRVIKTLERNVLQPESEPLPELGKCWKDRHDREDQPREGIVIRGDGQLPEEPHQQLFMWLVQMRSILDVLETYAQRVRVDSFEEHRWNGFVDAEDKTKTKEELEEVVATAGISYACYDIADQDRWRASDILMIGVGGQAPESSAASSRVDAAIELVPLSLLVRFPKLRQKLVMTPGCGFRRLCNSAAVIGMSYKGDDHFSAVGPRFRLLKALPKIDVQLSAQVEYLRYRPDLGEEEWDWTYGVRGDLGFSLMSLYVGVGRGAFALEGQLKRSYELSFGVGAGVPIERIKKVLRRLEPPWKRFGTTSPAVSAP